MQEKILQLQDDINDYLNNIIQDTFREKDLAVDPLVLDLSDDGKSIDIIELVIDENYRNQGLGTEVLNRIKKFADNNNLSITTTPLVGDLEDLVKKQGFVKQGNQYILKPDTPTNVVDDGRLIWGSEEFIDAILDDMRAAAQMLEMDETEITPLTQKYIADEKMSVANHIDFIGVYQETLDRTDFPEGMSKAKADDEILMFVEAAYIL